jgi:hypothetical protein
MLTNRKKALPEACRQNHAIVRDNLRHLMDEFTTPGTSQKGIGIIRLAKLAGIGVGSVQSILSDPYHSPSLRVLTLLSAALGVQVTDLLMDPEA